MNKILFKEDFYKTLESNIILSKFVSELVEEMKGDVSNIREETLYKILDKSISIIRALCEDEDEFYQVFKMFLYENRNTNVNNTVEQIEKMRELYNLNKPY